MGLTQPSTLLMQNQSARSSHTTGVNFSVANSSKRQNNRRSLVAVFFDKCLEIVVLSRSRSVETRFAARLRSLAVRCCGPEVHMPQIPFLLAALCDGCSTLSPKPLPVTVVWSQYQNLPDKRPLIGLKVNGKDGFTGTNTGIFNGACPAPRENQLSRFGQGA